MSALRVAVLGVGVMGSYHAEALAGRISHARVTVVSDADTARAERVAKSVDARVEADPFAAIAADDVDAVVIASPGPAHEAQVLACLDRRIPVLCEKPLTTDIATAYRIVQREAELDAPLVQLGFMRRFDAEYAGLRALVASGELGAPLLLHCVHRNPAQTDTFDSEMMMRDSVVHEADVARFLLGEEIVAVSVKRPQATSLAPTGVSDPMLVLMETASGRLVDVEIFVRTGVAYEVRTELVAEHGSAMIGLDQGLLVRRAGGAWGGQLAGGFVERFAAAYDTELHRWVQAARHGTIDGPGTWDGYAAVAVCEAGVEAVRSGERVPVRLGTRPVRVAA
ncbi:Gfo/Idh/MocA family protein [Cryptosporangium aurantiacum]|uniref:Inositol 2-dehydrogenase n=1 Tax=Cryptosporangium aurantiacum TaxID=134849 RepID=A0A1M7RIS0_9ACTN|nr:Gfo/Idh/MocA family oxidoreductase [Cryptosporangium aurantiacum]SHN46193.1 myo-inositol 2-dehydrogenase [Cryptosporangium aurantiacum]